MQGVNTEAIRCSGVKIMDYALEYLKFRFNYFILKFYSEVVTFKNPLGIYFLLGSIIIYILYAELENASHIACRDLQQPLFFL